MKIIFVGNLKSSIQLAQMFLDDLKIYVLAETDVWKRVKNGNKKNNNDGNIHPLCSRRDAPFE